MNLDLLSYNELFEAKIDVVLGKANLPDDVKARIRDLNSKVPNPSKYAVFMVQNAAGLLSEPDDQVIKLISNYDALGQRNLLPAQARDIQNLTLDAMVDAVNASLQDAAARDEKKAVKKVNSQYANLVQLIKSNSDDFIVVDESEDWIIAVPTHYSESWQKAYAYSTFKWCIGESENYFNQYFHDDHLVPNILWMEKKEFMDNGESMANDLYRSCFQVTDEVVNVWDVQNNRMHLEDINDYVGYGRDAPADGDDSLREGITEYPQQLLDRVWAVGLGNEGLMAWADFTPERTRKIPGFIKGLTERLLKKISGHYLSDDEIDEVRAEMEKYPELKQAIVDKYEPIRAEYEKKMAEYKSIIDEIKARYHEIIADSNEE